jgi:hypothetical protein
MSKAKRAMPVEDLLAQLQRCPFCNYDNTLVAEVWHGDFAVICHKCRAKGPTAQSKETAGDAWNRRAKSRGKR